MTLPEAFLLQMQNLLPHSEYSDFMSALTQTAPSVSLRLHPSKRHGAASLPHGEQIDCPVAWCPEGYYLKERPSFTSDPLFHAGCYYVQEASSMFLAHCIRTLIDRPVSYLDLCAAPGGKTTLALSALPAGSQVVCNEIDRKRARILSENVCKWGLSDVTVTAGSPADFARLKNTFDVILTDVPCSGEGMFRKDEGAIGDWSPLKVKECQTLQREILKDAWEALKPGGILIYSTCTYNTAENEEQIAYLCEALGGEAISIPTEENWRIHPPLIGEYPCYRFMPHYTRGEGLFMAAVRKPCATRDAPSRHEPRHRKSKSDTPSLKHCKLSFKEICSQIDRWLLDDPRHTPGQHFSMDDDGRVRVISQKHYPLYQQLKDSAIYVLRSGIEVATVKGNDLIPDHALALSERIAPDAFPSVDVSLDTALDYLRRKAITVPQEAPRGYLTICYQGVPLGFVKNLGTRCNNLYPQEWRIRN